MSITTFLPPPSPTGYLSPSFSFLTPSTSSPKQPEQPQQQSQTQTRPRSNSSSSSHSTSSTSSTNSTTSTSSITDSEYALENQLQWEESIRQLELIFNLVALPYFAKWAGRKWAYWMYGRYLTVGFSRSFWIGSMLDDRLRILLTGGKLS